MLTGVVVVGAVPAAAALLLALLVAAPLLARQLLRQRAAPRAQLLGRRSAHSAISTVTRVCSNNTATLLDYLYISID